MATYSDPVVSIQTGTGTYTCPSGKHARVSVRTAFNGGTNSCTVAGVDIFNGNAAGWVGHFEVILNAGESVVFGAGGGSWTALEYSNP